MTRNRSLESNGTENGGNKHLARGPSENIYGVAATGSGGSWANPLGSQYFDLNDVSTTQVEYNVVFELGPNVSGCFTLMKTRSTLIS